VADANLAVALSSAVALLGGSALAFYYVWVLALSLVNMVPAFLALRALYQRHVAAPTPAMLASPTATIGYGRDGTIADAPPVVADPHTLRCACHLGILLGVALMLCSGLSLIKYQILLRYMNTAEERSDLVTNMPQRWGYQSALISGLPCFCGIVTGLLPALNAMLISRARAERRTVSERLRALKSIPVFAPPHKRLTGPEPVLTGPAPNLASLNPTIETERV